MTALSASGGSPARRWSLAIVVFAVAILGAAWLARDGLLPRAARWLNVGKPPERCDYAFVLPGGEETRPFATAALVKAGLARQVLVPRVQSSPDVDDAIRQPAHEIIRQVLILEGVSPADILLLGDGSRSTYTDAATLAAFLRTRGECNVALVTNHYHTRRASWIFNEALGDRAGDIQVVAVPVDGFDEDTWWHTREGTLTYLAEFVKVAAYITTYLPLWIVVGTALAGWVVIAHHRRRKRARQHLQSSANA